MISVDDDLPSTRRVPPLICVPPDSATDPSLLLYSVELCYVEPGYAASMQQDARTYSFRFSIHATSTEAAIAAARARFDEAWRASGVGWERRLTEVRVVPGDG